MIGLNGGAEIASNGFWQQRGWNLQVTEVSSKGSMVELASNGN